jgi:hypothetical protein
MADSPYTRERLAEAASSSRTLSEALTKLGVDPKSSTRRYVRDRMRKMGIATEHFEREGTRWTREVLVPVVALSTSVYDVLRRLGLEAVGGHHSNISRRIKAYGIDTSHFAQPSRAGRRSVTLRPNCHAVTTTWCRGGARRVAHQGTLTPAGPPRPVP